MSCPYFTDYYFGFCTRSITPHVPSIAEMEHYCFQEGFQFCPIFESSLANDEVKGYKTQKTWLHDIYSDPLILLKAQSKD
jgi:hypothetical protein